MVKKSSFIILAGVKMNETSVLIDRSSSRGSVGGYHGCMVSSPEGHTRNADILVFVQWEVVSAQLWTKNTAK